MTWGDLLTAAGCLMLLAGLYLIDWRLALIGAGALALLAGVARVRWESGGIDDR